ncbi:COX15/CtaA family protein [Terrihabitans sp. B22-R8]|uniref:COX15/CtaA family protein n=1 Tax=Terrihabitans sp. B22-R8 TaxID=3425128 RepID=UPI00403CB1E8
MSAADKYRPIRIWLWVVAAMVAAMVLVGGGTRLTESGLSITEWRVVTGTLPPLSESAWQEEFSKYQQIPQYKEINQGMALSEFKYIYYWEWAHRLLGRLIGLVFAIPLLFFWWRGMLDRTLAPKLAVLLFLGGLQGAIGWWMVTSGLAYRTSVAPYRLAVHLTLAFVIFALILAVASSLKPRPLGVTTGIKRMSWAILLLVFVQVFVGGIVAGLDAGMSFTTWPLMDGAVVPAFASLTPLEPLWRNVFENPMTAQFLHRMIAYAIFVLALVHVYQAWGTSAVRSTRALAVAVLVQAALGILTLIYVVPIGLALAHQFGALGVVAHAVMNVQRFREENALRTEGRSRHRPQTA